MTTTDAHIELVDVTKKYGDLSAVKDLSIEIDRNELVCFLGPSGSGKTTTLNMIAGLESPTDGEVYIGGERVTDVPARERDVGLVFQNLALFERMTVEENLGFHPMVTGASRSEIESTVSSVAEIVNLSESALDRNVDNLNPSSRQRVALGRAIAAEPGVLLLDEPMSNLDREESLDMRGEVKQLQDRLEQTMVYVTHDQAEAMGLADRIMLIHQGELQQFATPTELYERPANRFVAGFIGSPGMNFLDGQFVEDGVTILGERIPDESLVDEYEDFDRDTFTDGVEFGIRPEHVVYDEDATVEFDVEITGREPLGSKTILYAATEQGTLTIITRKRVTQDGGDRAKIGASLEDLYLINPATGEVVY